MAAILFAGCCSCRDTASEQHFPLTVIHYSSGGGFSGMSSGYSILADGEVTRWTGHGGSREKSTTIGKIESKKYRELLSKIYRENPANIRQQETGNMTTSLEVVSDDVVYVYTWPGIHGDDTTVPSAVRKLRDIVWENIQTVISIKD
ncbi:MAG: hypothetical protein WBQ23_13290 [Bacteroidota bacterium]